MLPVGGAGFDPAGDGFKLIKAMGLSDNKLEYDLIRVRCPFLLTVWDTTLTCLDSVHVACARVKLSRDITFHQQPDRKVTHLCERVSTVGAARGTY